MMTDKHAHFYYSFKMQRWMECKKKDLDTICKEMGLITCTRLVKKDGSIIYPNSRDFNKMFDDRIDELIRGVDLDE